MSYKAVTTANGGNRQDCRRKPRKATGLSHKQSRDLMFLCCPCWSRGTEITETHVYIYTVISQSYYVVNFVHDHTHTFCGADHFDLVHRLALDKALIDFVSFYFPLVRKPIRAVTSLVETERNMEDFLTLLDTTEISHVPGSIRTFSFFTSITIIRAMELMQSLSDLYNPQQLLTRLVVVRTT